MFFTYTKFHYNTKESIFQIDTNIPNYEYNIKEIIRRKKMYNSSYEEYMQNVLGYNMRPQSTYLDERNIYEMQQSATHESMSLETLYPDIYKIIYPMVQKVCMRATGVINEELINDMTNEVYNAMEENRQCSKEVQKSSSEIRSGNSQNIRKIEETRQNNFLLRDLIRILIIRELLRRRRPGMGRPPMRPPYPIM